MIRVSVPEAWSMDAIHTRIGRILVVAVAAGLVVSACQPAPTPSPTHTVSPDATLPPSPVPSPSAAPQAGGTIYLLMENEQFDQIDPQRIYAGEDEAFFGATIYRSLETFAYSPDPIAGTTLTPDLATDLGTQTDGGRTWTFTLRPGVTFEDGSPIRCEDVKYGVSRTFATDVINQGPSYAILDLDIPLRVEGASNYPGPYKATALQEASFDKAVECSADHRTITFHLNRAIVDFNYATALGMSPVPKAADTGETYGLEEPPVSSGPYRVESYKPGKGGSMILVRNEHWDPATDSVRKAYPDGWEVDFGLDQQVIDHRLMSAAGKDAFAVGYGQVDASDLDTLFTDSRTPNARYSGRAISDFDPYVRYLWINVARVPNVEIRQAMLVALDRDAIRAVLGGDFYGDYADGVVKPTIGIDYAPTGIWDTFFGRPVPEQGDPNLAGKLLAAVGEPSPKVNFIITDSPTNENIAAIVKASLGKAGIAVTVTSRCLGYGCGLLFDPSKDADLGMSAWGADWPNAATVIPPLLTQAGGWDNSQVDDPAFNATVDDALATTDRIAQATKWQTLNREAVDNAWVIPTFFSRSQTLAGTKVGAVYRWPAGSSWPYGVMFVRP
jgi:peptide/nickel transport system substrate-binding protein